MTFTIKIYLLSGEENDIEMEVNCGLLLKSEIKKKCGYYDFTAIDMDTEKPYKFNGELPKNLLLTLISIDDYIKKSCCKNAGVYAYHTTTEKSKLTDGECVSIEYLYGDNGWELYGLNKTFRNITKTITGKTNKFVKIADEPKRKIRQLREVGDCFHHPNITGVFINKSIMNGKKYIVFKNDGWGYGYEK